MGRDIPVWRAKNGWSNASFPEIEKNNAQVEDPFGRGQALQQDRHRQDQAGPHEDTAHPYVEGAKDETEARQERYRFRRRSREGSAHDSLCLTTPWGNSLEEFREVFRIDERVKRFTGRDFSGHPASSRLTEETKRRTNPCPA